MPQLQVNYYFQESLLTLTGMWICLLRVLLWVGQASRCGRRVSVSRRTFKRVVSAFQKLFDLFNFICLVKNPEYRVDIKGMVSVDLMARRRMQRKADRNEWFQQRLMRPADVTEPDDFDYIGIRWMHEGRWGCDHPAADWAHPAWSELPSLEYFYASD
ncbi:uncharacterized protein LOC130674517 [Microplitis mediator]|uniref:uncharacterized protein LOC130674517 n=1 Tax=Microplitis mediator TaxID=375433 RepID=UPI002557843C|nr:uncharacterized protein LOC130674517 [Microplitis mediator]